MKLVTNALLVLASLAKWARAGPPSFYQIPIGIDNNLVPLYLTFTVGTPPQPAQLAFDVVHTDTWFASDNCWSAECLAMITNRYSGVASTSHISDGEIFPLTSKPTIPALNNPNDINWQNLGLEAQDVFTITTASVADILIASQWFLETFVIKTYPDYVQPPLLAGSLSFGLAYGAQMDQVPFIYNIFQQGQVLVQSFATVLTTFSPGARFLFVGDVEDPAVTAYRGNYTAADVPVFIKDGSWNFQMTNLTINGTDSGFNGAAVLDSTQRFIYVPRVVGAAIAELLGGTIDTSVPAYDRYRVECNTTLLPDIVLSTSTGDVAIPPEFYVVGGGFPLCEMLIRGRDVFMDQLSYRPIIQLGWQFFFTQFIKYDYQNETLSFAPPAIP